jgi:hypothetical protein
VTVDVGDVRQRIEGIAGCYLAEPNERDLAAKLRIVAEGPRRVDGRSAMAQVSIEGIACQLRQFYEEVCDGSGRMKTDPVANAS